MYVLERANVFFICSDFVRGKGKPPPEIDSASCHRLLKRSVAAIFAATGFDSKILQWK